MILTEQAVTAVKQNKRCKNLLALKMDKDPSRISDWLNTNKHDGPLTTITAVKIISKETGIPQSKLLTEEISK